MKELIERLSDLGAAFDATYASEQWLMDQAREIAEELERLTQPVGLEPVAKVNTHNVNQIDWLDMFSPVGCGTKLFSESQLRQVQAEKDEAYGWMEEHRQARAELMDKNTVLQAQVTLLREALTWISCGEAPNGEIATVRVCQRFANEALAATEPKGE